jgi:hypothetical protein
MTVRVAECVQIYKNKAEEHLIIVLSGSKVTFLGAKDYTTKCQSQSLLCVGSAELDPLVPLVLLDSPCNCTVSCIREKQTSELRPICTCIRLRLTGNEWKEEVRDLRHDSREALEERVLQSSLDRILAEVGEGCGLINGASESS